MSMNADELKNRLKEMRNYLIAIMYFTGIIAGGTCAGL